MRMHIVVQFCLLALFFGKFPSMSWAERNAGEVPAASELDEGARAVLERAIRPAEISPEAWADVLKQYMIKMTRNVDVHFYGEVIDQNLLPLEGAKVSGFVRAFDSAYIENLAAGATDQVEHEWAVMTDMNGRFAVLGFRGLSVHITKVEKAGYLAPEYDEYFRISEKHFHKNVHKADANRPVVFKMWANDEPGFGADLLRKEIKIDGRADGTEYRVDLMKGMRVSKDEEIFDVSIMIQSAANGSGVEGKYDWSFTLSAGNGGFIATQSDHPFEAPEVGYEPVVSSAYFGIDDAWSRKAQRKYYVRSRGGDLYAMIGVTVYAYGNGTALVRIDSVANATGSRNLTTLR